MKKIYELSDLQKGKIYYIDLPEVSYRPALKLKGKLLNNINEKPYISFGDLKYINKQNKYLQFPNGKPLILNLYKVNNLLYRIIAQHEQIILSITTNPELYSPCKIYEPQNERILVNFVMRNKIINDPYFDYK